MSVFYSDEAVNISRHGTRHDELNITRLCTGNDSDFMEMTACVGGLMGDDTAVEPDSPVLSPALEQENNVNHEEREPVLGDSHNKSVLYENESDDHDLSLTCVGKGGIISLQTAPSAAGYTSTNGRGLNKTVLFDGDDMETTQCLSLDASTKVGDDMELTQCLPLDVSMSIKSTCRWPFGKRQDGAREKISRYEDNTVSECVSFGDRGPFVESDELDVLEKVDTTAFLMELNTMEKPAKVSEVDSSSSEKYDRSLTSSLACSVSSTFPASVTSLTVTPANYDDGKALDGNTCSKSVNEQCYEGLLSRITDVEGAQVRFKCSQPLNTSSSTCVAAADIKSVKSDTSITAASTNEMSSSFVKSDVKEHRCISTSFPTKTGPEADDDQIVTCAGSSSALSTSAVISSIRNEAALSSPVVSSAVQTVMNQVDFYRCQLEKSLNEQVEYFPKFAEETRKADEVSASAARPAMFGAEAVESIFAAKESDEVSTCAGKGGIISLQSAPSACAGYASTNGRGLNKSVLFGGDDMEMTQCLPLDVSTKVGESDEVSTRTLAIVENGSLTTAVEESTQAAERVKVSETHDLEDAAIRRVTETDFSGLITTDEVVVSQTSTEAQQPLRNVAQSVVQTADDLLTRVKLANSMPHQIAPKFRGGNLAASAVRGFRPATWAVKQNQTSAYPPDEKPSPFNRQSSAFSAFQPYVPDLDRTKELGRVADASGLAGVSGNSSRMDLSAQHMELANNLTTSLVSLNVTEDVDRTKREEMTLEPIRNVTLPSYESRLSLSCAGDEVENLETSAAANMERSSSAKLSSHFGSTFTLPATTIVAPQSTTFCLPAVATTATDSMWRVSSQHCPVEVTMTNTAAQSMTFRLPSATTMATNSDLSTSSQRRQIEASMTDAAPQSTVAAVAATATNSNVNLSSQRHQSEVTMDVPAAQLTTFCLPAVATTAMDSVWRVSSQHHPIEVMATVADAMTDVAAPWSTTFCLPAAAAMTTNSNVSMSSQHDQTEVMMDVAACQSKTFCLPAVAATATKTDVRVSSQHCQIEVTMDVKKPISMSQVASTGGGNVDVDMEISGTCRAAESCAVVAAKSSSECGEDYSLLSQTDVSQSSVFCLAASEASPTHNTDVQSGGAESTSVSTNKVCTESSVFR